MIPTLLILLGKNTHRTIQHNTPTRTTSQVQWRRGIPPTAMQQNTPQSEKKKPLKLPYKAYF
jgi:hypothetical protein